MPLDPLFERAVAAKVADLHNADAADGDEGHAQDHNNDGTHLVSVDGSNSSGTNQGHPALSRRQCMTWGWNVLNLRFNLLNGIPPSLTLSGWRTCFLPMKDV